MRRFIRWPSAALCLFVVALRPIGAIADGASLAIARDACLASARSAPGSDQFAACKDYLGNSKATVRNKAEAHLVMGWIHANWGRQQEAIAEWQAAMTIDSAYDEPLLALGGLYGLSRQLDAALTVYDRALKLDPENWRAHAGRARALFWAGRPVDALSDGARAVELAPKSGEAHYVNGFVLEQVGKFKEAIAEYALSVVYQEADTSRLSNIVDESPPIALARAYFRNDDPADAAAALSAYVASLPEQQRNGMLLEQLASYRAAAGQYQQAADDLMKAVPMVEEPRRLPLLTRRAILLVQAGRKSEAQAELANVLKQGRLNTILRIQVFLENAGMDFVEINGVFDANTAEGLERCLTDLDCGQKLGQRL